MTLSERAADVRARTHMPEAHPGNRPTSANGQTRPPLRIVPAPTHTEPTPQTPTGDHSARSHLADAVRAASDHPVIGTHPPTVADAVRTLWPARDHVRHGLAGQLAAAAAGLIQVLGLAVCWGFAHVFFATKTQAAIFLLVLLAAAATWAAASHA